MEVKTHAFASRCRYFATWPTSFCKVTFVAIGVSDLPPATVAVLKAAGLADHLADPDDEIVLGESRMVCLFGSGTLGPKESYSVDEIVRNTRAAGPPRRVRQAQEQEANRILQQQRAERLAEEERRLAARLKFEQEQEEAARRRDDPVHFLEQRLRRLETAHERKAKHG